MFKKISILKVHVATDRTENNNLRTKWFIPSDPLFTFLLLVWSLLLLIQDLRHFFHMV